jgi:arylsulfatase
MAKAFAPWAVMALMVGALAGLWAGVAHAQQSRPNILVIWGDDIGVHNISTYTHAIMGYRTPNIDRIAREGALFTDAYAQQFVPVQQKLKDFLVTLPGYPFQEAESREH